MRPIAVISVFVLNLWLCCDGQRLRDSIYEPIYSGGPCFRRLNGTHQIGCSSDRGGSTGVLHAVESLADVQWLVEKASAGPYAVILPMRLFDRRHVDPMIARPDVVAGVIVVDNGTVRKPDTFSHDQRCPNRRSQWYSEESCDNSHPDGNVWNPSGTGLMYADFPFPIFYLPVKALDDIKKLQECFNKFNNFDLDDQSSRSLCAIEMDAFMFAAFDSRICIRRSNAALNKNLTPIRYCDPLADQSIFTTLFPRTGTFEKNKDNTIEFIESKGSVALVTTSLHATSMFEAQSEGFGAVTTVSGLVTWLATARALNLMFANDANVYKKNVLFAGLNVESFDYIGSQKMAWDLASGAYPYESGDEIPHLNPMSIGPHIHLGQFVNDASLLHAFTPNYNESNRNEMADQFIEELGSTVTKSRTDNLPPSSVHSFLRILNSSITQMSSIVLADHGYNFENKYYQSLLDDKTNLNYAYLNITSKSGYGNVTLNDTTPQDSLVPTNTVQMRLAKLSTSLARALYKHVTDKEYDGKVQASPFIVDELLYCYLESIKCPLLIASQLNHPVISYVIPPASNYIGSSQWYTASTHVTSLIAILLTGREVDRNKTNCKTNQNETLQYEWVSGWNKSGFCVQSNVHFTLAMSPAFLDDDYDFASGQYSTWTESVWSHISVRMFLRPAAWRGKLLLGTGCVIFTLSFLLVFLGRRHVLWLIEQMPSEESSESSPQTQSRVDC